MYKGSEGACSSFATLHRVVEELVEALCPGDVWLIRQLLALTVADNAADHSLPRLGHLGGANPLADIICCPGCALANTGLLQQLAVTTSTATSTSTRSACFDRLLRCLSYNGVGEPLGNHLRCSVHATGSTARLLLLLETPPWRVNVGFCCSSRR